MLTRKELLISGGTGFIAAAIYLLYVIFTSTNSTAVIGLLFLPVYGMIGALLVAGAYYLSKKSLRTRIILILLITFSGSIYCYKKYNLKKAQSSTLTAEDFWSIRNHYFGYGKEDILAAIAQNPAAPADLLQDLSGKGEAVQRALAENPKAPQALLEQLSELPLSYNLHSGLATNPEISQGVIARLLSARPENFKSKTEYELYQTYVLGPLTRHPKLSDEDFIKLAKWPQAEYFLVYGVIESGRASCELLLNFSRETYEVLRQNAISQLREQGCDEN